MADQPRAVVAPITGPIPPRKQAAHRHYGSHPYFTKRAWNVVQKYIEAFSEPGDLVLDPFGGSGVTAVETLVLRRRAIHSDISPLANFITWGIAVAPVDEAVLQAAYADIRNACATQIRDLYKLDQAVIDAMPVPYWHPGPVPLPKNADVETLDKLFHRRSLIALSILLHHINAISDPVIRDLLRLAFAATLNKTNLTFSSTTGRLESRGDSGIFRVYRYWIPPKTIELNVWEQFEHRYRGVLLAKRETNDLIGDYYRAGDTIQILADSATNLRADVQNETVDYIYTDPPYGAHIAYLDLSTMWHAWLGFDVTDEARANEVIEGGDLGKSKEQYIELLDDSITEMFRVLKWDRWLSIVFAHKDPAYWDAIVKSAQKAGFQYVNTAVQPSTTPSLHKRKNPLKVLSGELVLNFQKVKGARTIAITQVGGDVVQLIKNTAELVIVRHHGASTEDIYNDLVPKLLENGLLGFLKQKVSDITPLLAEEFDHSPVDGRWHIRPNTKVGSFIPLNDRIRFYLTDALNRATREARQLTFDELIFTVMPNLINGTQPTEESILDVLSDIGYSPDGQHWVLGSTTVAPTSQLTFTFTGIDPIPPLVAPTTFIHDEAIYRLAKLSRASGLVPHVGKKEQANSYNGEKLADLSLGKLPWTDLTDWQAGKIEQIDCLLLDGGRPVYAFEVEKSTSITSGIDRFLELLKVESDMTRRLVIVVDKKRDAALTKILRDSHYIGHPMYMENKLAYLYWDQLVKLYDRYVGQKAPSRETLLAQLDALVSSPKL
jgi:DNA methylase